MSVNEPRGARPIRLMPVEHQATTPRLFAATDAYGEGGIWENRPHRPSAPKLVLQWSDVKDDALWDAIVRLVESGEIQ